MIVDDEEYRKKLKEYKDSFNIKNFASLVHSMTWNIERDREFRKEFIKQEKLGNLE